MPIRTAHPQRLARIAGAIYALVIVIGLLNAILIDSRLVVPTDDAATVRNILAHPHLLHVGIAATLALYALVIVLAWTFYELLEVVGPRLARLGLLFRVAEAVVGVATILTTIFVASLIGNGDRVAAFEPRQLHALVGAVLDARTTGMDLVLVLVGVGGSIFCGLLFTSRFVPRWLAAWGIVTYLSLLVLGFLSLLWRDHPGMLAVIFYGPGALFELTIGFWLLVKGIDEERWRAASKARTGSARGA